MQLPFTKDQFLRIFASYNSAIEPFQLVFYALGLGCVLILAAQARAGNRMRFPAGRIVWSILGFFWIWDGALYHISFFSAINPAAKIFGALFILQGIFFLVAAIAEKTDTNRLPRRWTGVVGFALAAYALIAYPLIGAAAGHAYPTAPVFGVAPCPTVIFTFGALLISGRGSLLLAVIPILWAVVGGSAAFLLGIPEDLGLPAAGALAIASFIAVRRDGKRRLTSRNAATI